MTYGQPRAGFSQGTLRQGFEKGTNDEAQTCAVIECPHAVLAPDVNFTPDLARQEQETAGAWRQQLESGPFEKLFALRTIVEGPT